MLAALAVRHRELILNDAVFYRAYPLLYHKFDNIVIFRKETHIHGVAKETSIIRKLFIYFSSKKTMQKL